jgi:glucokinase
MPARRTIGVDIGGTRLLAGAVDADLGVHHRTQRAVSGLDRGSLLAAAVDAIDETRDAAGAEIAAIGFVQGTQTPAGIADLMAERLGLPAFSDSSANVVALAEHRAGAARGRREALVLTLGEEMHGAALLGGELQRRPVELESDSSLVQAHYEARHSIELAHDGDRDAIESVARLGRALGVAVARLSSTYNPEVVVFAGPLVAAGEQLLAPARVGHQVPIVRARFGVDGAIIGAGALAFDRIGRRGAAAA